MVERVEAIHLYRNALFVFGPQGIPFPVFELHFRLHVFVGLRNAFLDLLIAWIVLIMEFDCSPRTSFP